MYGTGDLRAGGGRVGATTRAGCSGKRRTRRSSRGCRSRRCLSASPKRPAAGPTASATTTTRRCKSAKAARERPARFVPFTQQEVDWLMEQVLTARAQGQSVRSCLQALSGGDHSLMLRYQNKYRAVIKSRPEYVQKMVEALNARGVACETPQVNHRVRPDVGAACQTMVDEARRAGRRGTGPRLRNAGQAAVLRPHERATTPFAKPRRNWWTRPRCSSPRRRRSAAAPCRNSASAFPSASARWKRCCRWSEDGIIIPKFAYSRRARHDGRARFARGACTETAGVGKERPRKGGVARRLA